MAWWNKRQPVEPVAPDPADRDFTGSDIWTIIASGLENHGMIMRRDGSAEFSRSKWGDGKYHLKVKVDSKPEPVLDLITDAGEPIKIEDWNNLTQEERKQFVLDHGARFKVKED